MPSTPGKINTTYDQVMYESFTYAKTQPPHISTVAKLFGLKPPALGTSKVLELGCASGGNLFSLALAYPDALFTGIDLSQEQIDLAEENRAWLGLENVTFLQKDIAKFDTKNYAGAFDYIICHGVYSWVPDAVREKILDLCARCLSPDGLAVISYNTLPGWNMVQSLREMMLYHTSPSDPPEKRISQSKALLEFLAENATEAGGYRAMIEEELKLVKSRHDSYLFHEHLAGNNKQFYFHEFAGAADRHGLAYVGDSSVASMFIGNLPKRALEKLKTVNELVRQEQYIDFVQNRRFRTSIICRADRTIKRSLDSGAILDFHLAPNMWLKQGEPGSGPAVFVSYSGQFTASDEMTRSLFMELIEARKPIHARELLERARARIGMDSTDQLENILIENGMQLVMRGFIILGVAPLPFAEVVGERPRAFPLARLQAQNPQASSVTNVFHLMTPSNMLANMVIARLDGTVTANDIAADLTDRALEGKLTVRSNGQVVTGRTAILAEMQNSVADILKQLADNALLVD